MRTFTMYKDKESRINLFIYYSFFSLYLKISGKQWNREVSERHDVYDRYGIIDTLGWRSRNGRFTVQHSDENIFMFGFILFGFRVEFIDY